MIVGITGYATAGKDTFAAELERKYEFTTAHFADKLRHMALAIDPYVQVPGEDNILTFMRLSEVISRDGYTKAKTYPDVRRFYQRLGTDAVRNNLGPDTWVTALMNDIGVAEVIALSAEKKPKNIVIPDVRFLNEAESIRDRGGLLVRIKRPGTRSDGHASETEQDKIQCDLTVHNNSTIEYLNKQVECFYGVLIAKEI